MTTEITQKDRIQNLFVMAITLAVIIFFIAVFFGVKYYYQPRAAETLTYNSFKFVKQGAIWYTNWQRNENTYRIGLRNSPKQVEDIPIFGELNNSFNKKNKIFIAFDPLSENKTFKHLALSASELTTQLTGPLGKQPVAACTRGEQLEACKERPIVNCDNRDLNVIILKSEEPTQITLDNTCITIQGKDTELIKAVEKSLYIWFGIINKPTVPKTI